MKKTKKWLKEWTDNDSNQAYVKEKAIIYYTAKNNVNDNMVDCLINYCSDKNLEIINTYKNDDCTKRGSKKSLFNMLTFIKSQKGRIYIVCKDFYDIFQDVGDLQILEPLITIGRITIHILEQNLLIDKVSYDEHMIARINAMFLMKYYYINNLSHNIKTAQQHFISNGRCMYLAPIGYKNVRDASGYADVVVDTIKAPIITKLFKEYSTGSYSIKTLTELAHTLGLKNRKGKPVSETCINDMLKNRFYIGMQRWNETLYPHKYPTIIDESLFDKVQEVLMEHTC